MVHLTLNRKNMKRILLIACLPLLAAFTYKNSSSNYNHYNDLAEQIKSDIKEYAVASSDRSRVKNIIILPNGIISLYFAGSNEATIFNLFELLKTQETSFGIQLNENETFIRFDISRDEYAVINFNSHAKAKEVYESFIELILAGKEFYTPNLDLDIAETRDSINAMLAKYASFKPQIRVSMKGSVIITNENMQFFTFNLAELKSNQYSQTFEVNGIQMVPCTQKNVAANNWIKFNTARGAQAFIKFDCISDAELAKIHQLLIHLRTSVMRVMYS